MVMNKEQSDAIQKHFGYSDDEMKIFVANPRNIEIMSKTPKMMQKTIIIEVVESHGCNSQHKVGDKFYFDGAGNLLTKLSPKKICAGIMGTFPQLVFSAHELFYAGVDPNKMRFKRNNCFDVGLNCGGWGRIVVEIRFEDRK